MVATRGVLHSRRVALAFATVGALMAGCGGGGSSGGADRPRPGFQLGTRPTVQKLETPLGVVGSRGSGARVFVAFNLKDREFNPADIQLEYGYDLDGSGEITGSEQEPSATDEYFPATAFPGAGDGGVGLDTATGRGADHLFVWDSAGDLAGARFVTQDFQYTPEGRQVLGSDGQPLFGNTPGIRLRMRANDDSGDPDRWGLWTRTKPFDLNNNRQPSVTIDVTGLNGVTPNTTGVTADEDVVLNLHLVDEDSALAGGADTVSIAVDYAPVPAFSPTDRDGNGFLDDPFDLSTEDAGALQWFPATPKAGTVNVALPSSPTPGTPTTFTWDSIGDVGTVHGDFLLRVTPFDSKSEHGPTVSMVERFRLDNYTVFTDTGAALSSGRVGHRATTLADNRVLVTGGRTTGTGSSVSTAELFFPGLGQTTFGAVAPTASLGTARSFHTQTRLQDDRVLVAGGFNAAGTPVNTLEVYDPATGAWTTLSATLTTARARHAAVLLANGDVLFAGGVDGSGAALATGEVFRAATETVTQVPGTTSAARHSATGALLPDGRVLIPGGKNGSGAALSSTELFTPTANASLGGFAAGPAMSSARAEHTVSAAVDGRVIVTGGAGLSTIAVFDPLTDSWDDSAPSMSSSRAGHTGILMGDGRILVAGGSDGATVTGTATQYDPGAASFDGTNGEMVSARRDAATVILNTGRVLIVGGTDPSGATLSGVEVYTPDGGFNQLPSAKIVTPGAPQSWAFGALIPYRLIDPEQDPARVIFQYSVSGGPWNTCTAKDDTIAGDQNEGVVSLETAAADSTLPVDYVLKNTVGDHLFVWDIAADDLNGDGVADLADRDDYPAVKVRVLPFGAGRGALATTNPFGIARNTRVIPRFDPFSSPASGTVDIAYHLQDIDGASPTDGDGARVEFEYARDLNGDKQILEDDGEAWSTCSQGPGGDGLGAGYTLVTSKTFDPDTATSGWHTFSWDSVRDLGSPESGETWTDVMVRITPYDFPAGDAAETKGRQGVLTNEQGLAIVLDPTALLLASWGTEGGQSYSGTALGGVKLDETITFIFSRAIDPASVNGTVGLDSLRVLVDGRQVLGFYRVDGSDATKVHFYPLVNGVENGTLKYDGSEDPTVLTRGATVSIEIPGYDPADGFSPETAPVLRVAGWSAGDGAVDVVHALDRSFSPAVTTTTAAGTAAYFARGVAPRLSSITPAHLGTGQSTTQSITVTFDQPISGEAVNPSSLAIRVDLDGDGVVDPNDSVIPGTLTLQNEYDATTGTWSATFTFTPLAGVNYPAGSTILVDFSGLAAADGTAVSDGTGARWFTTTAGSTTSTTFTESFDDQTNMDAASTSALWDDASFPGMLTGLIDGGDASDGLPSPDSTSGNVKTFSGKDTWNFTSLAIPKDEVWRFTGGSSNKPVIIKVAGAVDITGVLDVSGGDGESAIHDSTSSGSTSPSTSTTPLKGGAGIAGGGDGGDEAVTTTSSGRIAGKDGSPGTGASSSNAGQGGNTGTSSSIGQGGGGGGGHAEKGSDGGKYSTSTSTGSGGSGGTAYGSSTFSGGLTAGSGGGSGAMTKSSSSSFSHMHAGAGGAGGGAVKVVCNGTFLLRGTGVIDASGGSGGRGYYYAGGGGGGSGGSVWVVSGGDLTLHGTVDIQGGRGGRKIYQMASGTAFSNPPGNLGGDGASGRVRLEGPNLGTTLTNIVGGLDLRTVSSGDLDGGTGALGAFPGSSSTTINLDSMQKDSGGNYNFTTMNIPSGVTVNLTGSSAAKMRFTGNVTISGVLRANGGNGPNGVLTFSGGFNTILGGAAGPGGFAGGRPNTTSTSNLANGENGGGTGGGKGGLVNTASPLVSGTSTYNYYSGGAGGGSHLLNSPGEKGEGSRYVTNWMKTPGDTVMSPGAGDPSALGVSGLTGGAGGGGGGNSRFQSSFSGTFYQAGSGGGGGGAIAIETTGTFTLNSGGIIEAVGGDGGTSAPNTSVLGGAGGGGSGGTVLIRAGTVSMSSGATINTRGGVAGSSAWVSGTSAWDYGNSGGGGGKGLVGVQALNLPSILNQGAVTGLSTSTGSLSTAFYRTGDTGTLKWQTAAGLSPDFSGSSVTRVGNSEILLEGAMAHPVTGLRDDGNKAILDIASVGLSAGTPSDPLDGYKFWRLVFKLRPPNLSVPDIPQVKEVTIDLDTR